MICDKVRDVDEIGVFICADGIKLVERGDARDRFMSIDRGKVSYLHTTALRVLGGFVTAWCKVSPI